MRPKQAPTATEDRERAAQRLERRAERYAAVAGPTLPKQWRALAELIRSGAVDPSHREPHTRSRRFQPSPEWLAEHHRVGTLLEDAIGEPPVCPIRGKGPTCRVSGCEEVRG